MKVPFHLISVVFIPQRVKDGVTKQDLVIFSVKEEMSLTTEVLTGMLLDERARAFRDAVQGREFASSVVLEGKMKSTKQRGDLPLEVSAWSFPPLPAAKAA